MYLVTKIRYRIAPLIPYYFKKETTQSVTDKKDLPQTFEDRGKICIGFEEISEQNKLLL